MTRRRRRVTTFRKGWIGLLAGVVITAGCISSVKAQMMDTGETAEEARKNQGFNIRKEAAKFNDALEDFSRYRDKKAWELAFRSLETLTEAKRDGMVPAGKGFYVPSRQRVISSLTSLPPEGKQAFRLFYDAKAKQLLEKAQSASREAPPSGDPADKPVDEVATLREVYEKYFISSVGDRAADRLGDALFETGDFAGAAAAWSAVLKEFPDTTLPKLRLQIKRCTALARATQWDRFDDALRQVRTEFAGERVSIGGKEVVAVEYLEQLRAAPSSKPATTSSTKPTTGPTTATAPEPEIPEPTGPVALPTDDTPAWQIKLTDEAMNRKLANALNMNQWAARFTNLRGAMPASCTDGRRVYVNWFGIIFAADVKTGKMLWRNRKFSELGDKLQNIVNSATDVDVYTATVAPGARLFVTGLVFSNLGNYQEPVRLVSMNGRDGKVNWSSTNGSLSNWSFLGAPVIVGDVVYAAAHTRNGNDVSLLAIGTEKGELMWSVALGTAQGGNNPYRGGTIVPDCMLVPANGSVYVLTNNGAVIAVDSVARRVDWAYTFPAPPVMFEQNVWFGGPQPMPKPKMRAAAFIDNSTLYVKEENGDAVYAIDLAGPSLLWKRPIDREDTVARLDDGRLLVIGQDLGAIDTKGKTHPMTWSARMPDLFVRLTPVVTDGRVFAFAPRGIFEINTTNGDTARILRGADLDSFGGTLNRAPGRLIAVSNLAVTAYPVSDGQPQKAQPSQQAARPSN
jgi:outer membrane protein assembly factor BamB